MPLLLAINGIEPTLLAQGFKRTPKEVGERGTAEDGTPYASIRRRKWLYEMRLGPHSQADAKAWTGLINGDGHYFAWDADLYSNQGLGPNAGHNGFWTSSTKKYGAGAMYVYAAGTLGAITYATALGSSWTVWVWHWESGWQFYVVRSDGAKWKNGVAQAAGIPSWMAVTSGSLTLYADAPAVAGYYDDLVALPFKIPDDWPTAWGTPAAAWPVAQPAVQLDGTLLPAYPVNAQGRVVEVEPQRIMLAGVWTTLAEVLHVELEEL